MKPQPDERYIEPFECQSDACGRKGPFKLLPEQSEYEDQQKIGLQDLNESAKPGQPLREIIVLLKGVELIASIPGMGSQCTVTGIVRLQQKKETSIYHTFLEAVHIEPKETEIDLSISAAEKQEFNDLAAINNGDDIIPFLINATAPEILGYRHIKEAQLCTIVSGSSNSKTHQREHIHMIVCGDPGTAKTAMSKSPRVLVPRSQYSAGRGGTVAGLTAAVIKDELSGSGYTAQAGALILADNSIMVLDEADKLEKEDFQALNTALEEGFIEIHKGGINQKFNTRFSMIALCNPKNIRFDPYEPLANQIRIPADTLSRFDLVFKIMDIPEPNKDRAIGEHIAKQWMQRTTENDEEFHYPQEKLSKYLQYAKTFEPEISEEGSKTILEYYLTLRKPDKEGVIAATARQLNGLFRITKSIAKLRLSNICSKDDANNAIDLHKASMETFRDPKTGKIDIDIILGMGQSQRDRYRQIRDIIQDLQGNNGSSAHYNDIIAKAEEKHIGRDQAESDFDKMKHTGEIIEVSNGLYRVI